MAIRWRASIASEHFLLPETDSQGFLVVRARPAHFGLEREVSSCSRPFLGRIRHESLRRVLQKRANPNFPIDDNAGEKVNSHAPTVHAWEGQAARWCHEATRIARNHPFVDGNKRTAFVVGYSYPLR